MSPGDCFERLWHHVSGDLDGAWKRKDPDDVTEYVRVAYLPALEGMDPEMDGFYDANDGFPQIHLLAGGREPFPSPSDRPDLKTQPEVDACILAHEHGHFLSDVRGNRTSAYVDAVLRFQKKESPLPQDRGLILAEEERAWDHGHETLTSLGVTEWQTFEERKRDGLAYYAAKLGDPTPNA
jgi:hypothetical protein